MQIQKFSPVTTLLMPCRACWSAVYFTYKQIELTGSLLCVILILRCWVLSTVLYLFLLLLTINYSGIMRHYARMFGRKS